MASIKRQVWTKEYVETQRALAVFLANPVGVEFMIHKNDGFIPNDATLYKWINDWLKENER